MFVTAAKPGQVVPVLWAQLWAPMTPHVGPAKAALSRRAMAPRAGSVASRAGYASGAAEDGVAAAANAGPRAHARPAASATTRARRLGCGRGTTTTRPPWRRASGRRLELIACPAWRHLPGAGSRERWERRRPAGPNHGAGRRALCGHAGREWRSDLPLAAAAPLAQAAGRRLYGVGLASAAARRPMSSAPRPVTGFNPGVTAYTPLFP